MQVWAECLLWTLVAWFPPTIIRSVVLVMKDFNFHWKSRTFQLITDYICKNTQLLSLECEQWWYTVLPVKKWTIIEFGGWTKCYIVYVHIHDAVSARCGCGILIIWGAHTTCSCSITGPTCRYILAGCIWNPLKSMCATASKSGLRSCLALRWLTAQCTHVHNFFNTLKYMVLKVS